MYGSTLAIYVRQQLQQLLWHTVRVYSSLPNYCWYFVVHQLGAEALLHVVQVISSSWLAQLVKHAVLVTAW